MNFIKKWTFIDYLLAVAVLMVLMVFAGFGNTAQAQDSGAFYNFERDGEGLIFLVDGDRGCIYLFTYQPSEGRWNIEIPDNGLVDEENCTEQRWFFASDPIVANGNAMEGFLWITVGLDYPKGIPDPGNPFRDIVGEAHVVGDYLLIRSNDGWRLKVIREGDVLDEDDPLYGVHEFTTPLFMATD